MQLSHRRMGCLYSCIARVFSSPPTNDKIYKELQDLKKQVRDEFADLKRIIAEQPKQYTNEDPEHLEVSKLIKHGGHSKDIEMTPLLQPNDVNEGEI